MGPVALPFMHAHTCTIFFAVNNVTIITYVHTTQSFPHSILGIQIKSPSLQFFSFFLSYFFSTKTCKCGWNILCMCVSCFICAFVICPCRRGHSGFFVCACEYLWMCVFMHARVCVRACVSVCHSQRRWWEVRGQMQPAFQTPGIYFDNNNNNPPSVCPTQASSPDSAKLRDHWAWHRHTHEHTHTHLLELQLCTTSQSNTSLLSKRHQHTPTTLYLRAEGFQEITRPTAAMLEVLSSWETVIVRR